MYISPRKKTPMNPQLNRNTFLVKEHVGMFKASNSYDIYDPANGTVIMNCREEGLSVLTKIFRFTGYKTLTPFNVVIKTTEGQKVLAVKRGINLFLSKVEVRDENDKVIGIFKQKLFTIGGKFDVLDANGTYLCSLKGKWTGWDFKFVKDNLEFAHVTKKWAGMSKEFFTTADNYILNINENVPQNSPLRQLIMAAVMCIDMVLKEK